MHYEFEGQSSRMGHSAQQRFNKEGLFALGLKGWEECGYTDGVGRRGHFRQGGWRKQRRGDGSGHPVLEESHQEWRVKGAAGNTLGSQHGSREVMESHTGE